LLQNCALPHNFAMLPMHIHRTLSVALVIIWSTVGVSCSYGKGPCTKPAVRKEWRAFSTKEKAEWIRAVNVRMRISLVLAVILRRYSSWLQCLSHQPHDPALAPSVDPSISLIPPVNASGSYYDGMNMPILTCLW
jgi:tyrosinase